MMWTIADDHRTGEGSRRDEGLFAAVVVDLFAVDTFRARPAHVPRPAELFEPADDAGTGVDLALEDAMASGRRVGVVQVVPRLAHGQEGQPPHVAGLVATGERALADGMTDRIDRPRDVVQEADANQRGPEERRRRTLPRPGRQPPDERDRKSV